LLIKVVDLGFRRCRRRTKEFFDLMYENRMGSIRFSFWFGNENRMAAPSGCLFQNQNENRMSMPSGCHFQIKWIFFYDNRMGVSSGCHFILKWQPDDGVIRLSFYFEMITGWHTHPVVIFFKMWTGWGVIRFLFFARMNRIRSVVELKFYIRINEEDIRVQEEFVVSIGWSKCCSPFTLPMPLTSPFLNET